jgi:hypothetical protein
LGWRLSDHGKTGHVLPDGTGYLLYVTGTGQRWKKAKHSLSAKVTQDGDNEGMLRLDRLPTAAEAAVIRSLIVIRKRRPVTAAVLFNLERAQASVKSPVLASPCVFSDEAA